MNEHLKEMDGVARLLVKSDPLTPAFKIVDRCRIAIKAGTLFAGHRFAEDTLAPDDYMRQGESGASIVGDYIVLARDGDPIVARATAIPTGAFLLGGFHLAPGGNAPARAGGDDVPAVNPCSLWDINFRPACADPRGMALIERKWGAPFWCDIYLTGARQHADGTSKFGVEIADGDNRPIDPAWGRKFERFDYAAACAVMAANGKGLLSFDEFAAAAYGVTEKSVPRRDPETTGLDAPRTSKFGLMQATGNLWIWGHDGDPESPRASLLGGSWFNDGGAGSRCADLGDWPGDSRGDLGARGRSDHLQLD